MQPDSRTADAEIENTCTIMATLSALIISWQVLCLHIMESQAKLAILKPFTQALSIEFLCVCFAVAVVDLVTFQEERPGHFYCVSTTVALIYN